MHLGSAPRTAFSQPALQRPSRTSKKEGASGVSSSNSFQSTCPKEPKSHQQEGACVWGQLLKQATPLQRRRLQLPPHQGLEVWREHAKESGLIGDCTAGRQGQRVRRLGGGHQTAAYSVSSPRPGICPQQQPAAWLLSIRPFTSRGQGSHGRSQAPASRPIAQGAPLSCRKYRRKYARSLRCSILGILRCAIQASSACRQQRQRMPVCCLSIPDVGKLGELGACAGQCSAVHRACLGQKGTWANNHAPARANGALSDSRDRTRLPRRLQAAVATFKEAGAGQCNRGCPRPTSIFSCIAAAALLGLAAVKISPTTLMMNPK